MKPSLHSVLILNNCFGISVIKLETSRLTPDKDSLRLDPFQPSGLEIWMSDLFEVT